MRTPITRKKAGKKFVYIAQNGTPVKNSEEVERINHLAIPPAWEHVEIAKSLVSKIQATGIDAAGRKQYVYNPKFRAKQDAAKFDRIIEFGRKLPELRGRILKDMQRPELDKAKVTACAINLMDEAYFRVGNEQYAKEHKTYGLTTLRSKHLEIKGDTVIFDFTGKSYQHQHKRVKNRVLARIMKQLDEMPGHELFRYYDEDGQLCNLNSSDINDYIKETIGEDYTAKDFRTWGGTLLMCIEFAQVDRPKHEKERQQCINECIKHVAERLGNTPAVARGSYIDPRVIQAFEKAAQASSFFGALKTANGSDFISAAENCALTILSS